jgi:hypothetical protein
MFRRKVRRKKEAIEAANQALLNSGIFLHRSKAVEFLLPKLVFFGLQLEIIWMWQLRSARIARNSICLS